MINHFVIPIETDTHFGVRIAFQSRNVYHFGWELNWLEDVLNFPKFTSNPKSRVQLPTIHRQMSINDEALLPPWLNGPLNFLEKFLLEKITKIILIALRDSIPVMDRPFWTSAFFIRIIQWHFQLVINHQRSTTFLHEFSWVFEAVFLNSCSRLRTNSNRKPEWIGP